MADDAGVGLVRVPREWAKMLYPSQAQEFRRERFRGRRGEGDRHFVLGRVEAMTESEWLTCTDPADEAGVMASSESRDREVVAARGANCSH